MLDIKRALNNDSLMRALTGLNRVAFEQASGPAYQAAPPVSKAQKRAVGDGRKPTLKRMSEKLFFVLFHFKCYPTFDLAGLLFDVDRSQSNRWLHKLQPILEAALEQEMVLPERQIKSMAEFVKRFPEVERIIIDGVERPIQRSQDNVRQRRTY